MIIAKKKFKKRYIVLLCLLIIILADFLMSKKIYMQAEKLPYKSSEYIRVYVFNDTNKDDIKLSIRSNESSSFRAQDVTISPKSANVFVMEVSDIPTAYDCLEYNFEIDEVKIKFEGEYFHRDSLLSGIEEQSVITKTDNMYTATEENHNILGLFIPFYYWGEDKFVLYQFLEKHFGVYTTQVVKLEIEDTANENRYCPAEEEKWYPHMEGIFNDNRKEEN